MRSTITLNGIESSEIEGLLIQSLPPISKPLMRTQIEEIDGRDGDIVTNLGFSAYTKEFTIGLYGDFDINEVIKYFTSQGTAIFSNEPDKYYSYQIIDQIDFERLIRYRTATVSMHCQPFKYSATEGADILSGSDNFATLDQSLNTDSSFYTYTSNVQADVTATRTASGTGGKFFAVFTIPVVQGITYHLSGNVSSNVTMYAYTDRLRGTSAGIAGKPLKGDYIYTATFTGTMVLGFYSSVTNLVFIRNFFVTNEAGATVSGEGSMITLENTALAPFLKFDLYGDTEQATYSGRNLATSIAVGSGSVGSWTITNGVIKNSEFSGTYVGLYLTFSNVNISANETAYASLDIRVVSGSASFNKINDNLSNWTQVQAPILSSEFQRYIFKKTYSDTKTLNTLLVQFASMTNAVVEIKNIMVSKSEGEYEPYTGGVASPNPDYPQEVQTVTGVQTITITDGESQSQSYTVDLGSIELCKIGTYQDYIYKNGNDWYLRKNTWKVTFNGSESWFYNSNNKNLIFTNDGSSYLPSGITYVGYSDGGTIACNYFIPRPQGEESGDGICWASSPNFMICNYGGRTNFNSAANFKTWLSSHNMFVYYQLSTPYDTQITDEELLAQLEALYTTAHAYKGTTNLISTAANLPHIMSVAVAGNIDSTITNAGNTTARPKLTLFGSGNIGIYLNGLQMFNVALGAEGHITIDTNAMEAYQDTTNNLKNRLVTGDYSNFVLQAGDNQLSFSGNAIMCVVENYSRWI